MIRVPLITARVPASREAMQEVTVVLMKSQESSEEQSMQAMQEFTSVKVLHNFLEHSKTLLVLLNNSLDLPELLLVRCL